MVSILKKGWSFTSFTMLSNITLHADFFSHGITAVVTDGVITWATKLGARCVVVMIITKHPYPEHQAGALPHWTNGLPLFTW